ncbi:hypothetical protein JTB14_026208 [Gonioctena quinquepunctata]|nr:hypothetical protein JTB14_026208 [Gonioctena quinquepunctata]
MFAVGVADSKGCRGMRLAPATPIEHDRCDWRYSIKQDSVAEERVALLAGGVLLPQKICNFLSNGTSPWVNHLFSKANWEMDRAPFSCKMVL